MPPLIQHLQTHLPGYMVPRRLIILESLPLTPSGKIDRRALPQPQADHRDETDYEPPQTPLQRAIADIWSDLLQVEQVGIHDNFFALGGHSLLATRLVSRLRDRFAVEFPLHKLFQAATVADLSYYIQHLENHETAPIEAAPRDVDLPASFVQQSLWYLQQFDEANTTYNMPIALEMEGSLNIEGLQFSLTKLVARHESLRTIFQENKEQIVQIITPARDVKLPIIDLTQQSKEAQKTAVTNHITQELNQPFDLSRGPLLRATLLKLSPSSHILLLTVHHIVADGWSISVMVQDIAATYSAFTQGNKRDLPDLPIQYADFSYWQQNQLNNDRLAQLLAYWTQQLAGVPPLLELPIAQPRPPALTFRGEMHTFEIPADLTRQLKALSHEAGTTLFMTLLAAFATLLYRYSSQTDIVIGSPVANRNRHEFETLVGFFVNTIVMRLDLSNTPRFIELLNQTRQVALDAYTHQEMPFEKLVEALQPERNLTHMPIFQTMFILQNNALESFELPGLFANPVSIERNTAKFDLTLEIVDDREKLHGAFEYNSDLFRRESIERMGAHWQNLLAAIVRRPDTPVSRLPLLSPAEQSQLLTAWNQTQTEMPPLDGLHHRVETQVMRTPDQVAVSCQGQTLTYRALNRRANQLAHHLQSLGVQPETPVGIAVTRSLNMVVGILAILKAGGAYVPLDPAYPQERLAYMLADTRLPLILTETALRAQLPATEAQHVLLDEIDRHIRHLPQHNPAVDVQPEHLAYVLYTSGSTGQPKGVAISHQGPLALINWAQSFFTPAQRRGVLAATSINFDLSVFELFLPLSCGGTAIIAPDVLHLPHLPEASAVTLVNTVPSVMTELLRLAPLPPTVTAVNLAGEPLHNALVQQLYAQPGVKAVYNLYGPSEDTTYSTYAAHAKGSTTEPTIGRPLNNTTAYLLDEWLQPVPIGVPGELYLGGQGLARGYFNQPGLTADRFIPHPFSELPGARLYRTGDMARYLPEGELVFLGRRDQQVKMRGFRIELGEIEAVLKEHPLVVDTAVTLRQDNGEKALVAYIVCAGQTSDETLSELRQHLQTHLPGYMVPRRLIILESLPLTPSGKIDRRALPQPQADHRDEFDYEPPQTPLQQAIADIWSDLLQVEQVGIHDNFFALGGHSLLATRLVSRLRDRFAVELSLRRLLEMPTIAAMSEHIDALLYWREGEAQPAAETSMIDWEEGTI